MDDAHYPVMPHLLVAISSHGFGHLAQMAPVIRRLRERLPSLELTLRTALPKELLEQRIDGTYTLQSVADDFGMLQRGALEVDLQGSLKQYRRIHGNWPREVERVAAELVSARPDLILADVPYLTLAAAHHAGIPAIALCSLNWHAILKGYLAEGDEPAILQQMHQAYASAASFLRPEPSMAMPGLDNLVDIGVVARSGYSRRERLFRNKELGADERLVLVAMGGIDHRLPLENWPEISGYRFVVPAAWRVFRSDCLTIESCRMDFSDLLASVDAVITKPGYGTFAEAVLNAVPVIYVRRGDWPEEPYLIDWLEANANCLEVSRDALEKGKVAHMLQRLFSMDKRAPVEATGVEQAVSEVLSHLTS